jgi:hypothetical protein
MKIILNDIDPADFVLAARAVEFLRANPAPSARRSTRPSRWSRRDEQT